LNRAIIAPLFGAMSKVSDEQILEVIKELRVAGASLQELSERFGDGITRRTLQRRLQKLVEGGQIKKEGKARATRYRVIHHYDFSQKPPTSIVSEDSIPYNAPEKPKDEISGPDYSTVAREVVNIVRAPQETRQSVGYRREFLDAYEPNETFYLPQDLRQRLMKIGRNEHYDSLPAGTHARQIFDRLIIDLSWNSSRLEGNTFSLLETDYLLEQGKSDEPHRAREAIMIFNHKTAIEMMVENPDALGFNRYTFMNLHAALTEDLMTDPSTEGALRNIPVGIGGSVFHPVNKPQIIEECFDQILRKADAISDPWECCFFLMVHLPYLQPFEDGNKRTSRLAANLPLIKQNLAPLSFVGLPARRYTEAILSIYELNRLEPMVEVFAWAYEQSAGRYMTIRQEVGEQDPVKLHYRHEIKARIREVVVKQLGKREAASYLQSWASRNVTADFRESFVNIVEERLLDLTEGNIFRVRILPSEFHAWWAQWDQKKRVTS
jgi:fido (protein-threonine AMPylation protein)